MATASRSSLSAWKRDVDDNTVEYFIFPELSSCSTKVEAHERLKDFKDKCMSTVQSDLEAYIWQNEPFALHVPPESRFQLVPSGKACSSAESGKDVLPPFLWGRTCYADSVDDEWFIVYLVTRLTREFPGAVGSRIGRGLKH